MSVALEQFERRIGEDGIQRLRTLYSIMCGVPDKAVDLWGWRKTENGEEYISDKKLLKEFDCGTTACAVGWACAYPEFQAQGLGYPHNMPLYRDNDSEIVNWATVQRFFDLNYVQASFLFNIHGDRELCQVIGWNESGLSDKRKVLLRIRYLLLQQGAIPGWRYHDLADQEARL